VVHKTARSGLLLSSILSHSISSIAHNQLHNHHTDTDICLSACLPALFSTFNILIIRWWQ